MLTLMSGVADIGIGCTPIRTLVTKRKIVPEDCDARTHWQITGIVCYTRRSTRHILSMRRGVRVCSRMSPCTIHGKRLFSWRSARSSLPAAPQTCTANPSAWTGGECAESPGSSNSPYRDTSGLTSICTTTCCVLRPQTNIPAGVHLRSVPVGSGDGSIPVPRPPSVEGTGKVALWVAGG